MVDCVDYLRLYRCYCDSRRAFAPSSSEHLCGCVVCVSHSTRRAERKNMKDFVKMPENNAGTLKNVEETEAYDKAVPERQKKI